MMFTNIQSLPKASPNSPISGTSQDPAQQVREALTSCHDRIRYFVSAAERLARAENVPAKEVTNAAERIIRYFTVALPLHEADENVSLHPRLQAAHAGPRVFTANESMIAEHRVINDTLQQLLPLWKKLQQEPTLLPSLSDELTRLTAELAHEFDMHLNMEEQILFPAMERLLSSKDLADIAAEIQARRAT